jgi:ArsR family transcriptional regulator, cadmium/lead-responsive transcriptional repressor
MDILHGIPAVAVDAAALARVGMALADENRRRLLLALLERPAYPSDLAEHLGMTRGNVSNHLSCLRGCGLARGVPAGRRVRYELADPKLAHALAELAALVLLVDHQGAQGQACTPDDYHGETYEPADTADDAGMEDAEVRHG